MYDEEKRRKSDEKLAQDFLRIVAGIESDFSLALGSTIWEAVFSALNREIDDYGSDQIANLKRVAARQKSSLIEWVNKKEELAEILKVYTVVRNEERHAASHVALAELAARLLSALERHALLARVFDDLQ